LVQELTRQGLYDVWLYKDQSGRPFEAFLKAATQPLSRVVIDKKPNPELMRMWEEFAFVDPERGVDKTDVFNRQAQFEANRIASKHARPRMV